MPSRRTISEEEIEDGLNVVARLIDRYGDVYWPVFERLERELEEALQEFLLLTKVLSFMQGVTGYRIN